MTDRLRILRFLSLCACCSALSAVGACADPPEPLHLEGTFALVDINGVAPPVVVPKETDLGVGLQTVVVADTLTFVRGGTGQWIHVAYREPIGGGPPEDVSWTDCSHYEGTRQAFHLRFRTCSNGHYWGFGDDARLVSEDTLIRDYYGAWRYVRVGPGMAP